MKCLNGLTIYEKIWWLDEESGIMIIKKGKASMTPIESIYEIQSAVLDLRRYLQSRNKVVSYRAQERYEQWVDRFFRENINVVEPEKRNICLHDFEYFLKLLESTVEYYYLNERNDGPSLKKIDELPE